MKLVALAGTNGNGSQTQPKMCLDRRAADEEV